jgi:uncharacterized protein
MNRKRLFVIAALLVVAIAGAAYYWFMLNGKSAPPGGQSSLITQTIDIAQASVTAEIANTDESRKQGLSKRSSLAPEHGMLFVFPKDGNWGIWMKDMHFSIDIIWADAAGKVVALNASVSPETYPAVFYPHNYTRYVLEVPAGFVIAHGITVGSTMSLPQ